MISGVIQFIQYLILTVNFRAIAHEQYVFAGVTAGISAILAAIIVRRVVKDDSWWTIGGMAVGGGLADMVGIHITRGWS